MTFSIMALNKFIDCRLAGLYAEGHNKARFTDRHYAECRYVTIVLALIMLLRYLLLSKGKAYYLNVRDTYCNVKL